MHLQLDQALDGPLRWREAIPVAAADLRRDETLVLGDVDCEGSLALAGTEFLLEARLRYRHRLQCDRCLAQYEEDVDLPVHFIVKAAGEAEAEANGAGEEAGARELEITDLSTLTALDGAVDLLGLVREQVSLNVPMKPLCNGACKGLCPQCGADRNREACTCDSVGVDSRWSGLEALRERLDANPN